VSKSLMVEEHLRGRGLKILDVGAGSGWFSRRLLQRGIAGRAVCVDPGYPSERDELVDGHPLSFRRSVERVDADVVLLMDVLEHVEDDVALLSSYVRRAAPGTRFLLTVPAFQFLWSAHDVYLEHHRRYTLAQLRSVAHESGLRVVSAHYYFAAILPVAVVLRLFRRGRTADRSDMKPVPAWLNRILQWLLSAERNIMRANRAAGLTVVCYCEC
jgi:SAM-dependent methyltransferase